MSIKDTEKIRLLLLKYKEEKNADIKKSLSYSITISLFLSKDIFSRNVDIKEFLIKNEILLKDYLFQSRTALIGRIIRIIEDMEISDLNKFISNIHLIAFAEVSSISKVKKKKKSEENYYDSLLKEFGKNLD